MSVVVASDMRDSLVVGISAEEGMIYGAMDDLICTNKGSEMEVFSGGFGLGWETGKWQWGKIVRRTIVDWMYARKEKIFVGDNLVMACVVSCSPDLWLVFKSGHQNLSDHIRAYRGSYSQDNQ